MAPYHTLIGNSLTIYLELTGDTDDTLGNAIDNAVQQLSMQWGPIASANGLTITFAFGPNTAPMINAPPAGINVATGLVPPGGVGFFEFTVGHGANAQSATRSGQVSYVDYGSGKGYIYEITSALPTLVPALSHEVGHVLGLSDRYYEGLYWLANRAINRTCRQIRRSDYIAGLNDFRDGVADSTPALHQLPRLAVRATLPMAGTGVGDAGYAPTANLMSSGASALTAAQFVFIGSQTKEPNYRKTNWVAILGDWERRVTPPAKIPNGAITVGLDYSTPENFHDLAKWIYPAWEATAQDGGQGLLFLPPGHLTPFRYGCVSAFRRGKALDGDVIQRTRLAAAMGKTRVFAFGGTTYNVIGMNVVHPNWMCHTRQMISDLK